MKNLLVVTEANMTKVEQLRNDWEALSSEEKRKRALELLDDGYSQRGLAKALNIPDATLRYHLKLKQVEPSISLAPAAHSGTSGDTAKGSSLGATRPALNIDSGTATKRCTSPDLIQFLKDTYVDGVRKRAATKRQDELERARINDLIRAFAGFLVQNWSLEPQPCLQILRMIEPRLNEAELSRHLPQPLPAGTNARRFLARIAPEPHTEDFEQVVHRAVVGLLYLGQNPDMRRQILRGLVELFRLDIQRAPRRLDDRRS